MTLEMTEQISVSISKNAMEAYLTLMVPMPGETYTVDMLKDALASSGVVYGIKEDVLEHMVIDEIYSVRMVVAVGKMPTQGTDGSFQYNFRQKQEKSPRIREDGTVDYWSLNLIETVVEGQIIAIYTPAVQGEVGYKVTGEEVAPKIAREMPPLKGRGFSRTEDNLTYVASLDGKIESVNGRINITNFHEIHGNVDSLFGNIDFAGDIVIHGNVCTGMSVRAGGTLTVDGVVEGASLWAGKDIILRGGVLGDNKAQIFSRGNIYAKFFEYANVEALGTIQADTFLQCEVECRQNIIVEGKKGVILGGKMHAIAGIEANEIGNTTEIKTEVEVGVGDEFRKKLYDVQEQIKELNKNLEKIKTALKRFEEMEKEQGISFKQDPRRMALLRASICDSSKEKACRVQLAELNEQEVTAKMASLKVNRIIYPGVYVTIGSDKVLVKGEQVAVEYILRNNKIALRGDEVVE